MAEVINAGDFNPDDFEEVINTDDSKKESIAAGDFDPMDFEEVSDDVGQEEIGAFEAFGIAAADPIPGIGGLVAGASAKAGELYSKYFEESEQVSNPEAERVLREAEIRGPNNELIKEKGAEETGVFQDARVKHFDREDAAFDQQTAASVLGGFAGPGIGLSVLAKKIPTLTKMAAKSPKITKALKILGPDIKELDQIKHIPDAVKRLQLEGLVEEAAKLKWLKNKKLFTMAAREGAKMGAIGGVLRTDDPFSKQAILNSAIGGASGAVFGTVVTLGGLGFSSLGDTSLGKWAGSAFGFGEKGMSLDPARADKTVSDFAEDLAKKWEKFFKKYPKAKALMIKKMDRSGKTIDTKEDLELVYGELLKLSGEEGNEAKKALESIGESLKGGHDYTKALEKMNTKVDELILKANDDDLRIALKFKQQQLKEETRLNYDAIRVSEIKKKAEGNAEIAYQEQIFLDKKGKEYIKTVTENTRVPSPLNLSDIKMVDKGDGKRYMTYYDKRLNKAPIIIPIDISFKADPEKLNATEVSSLIDKIDKLTYHKDAPSFLKEIMPKLKKPLKEKLLKLADQEGLALRDINEKLHLGNSILQRKAGKKITGKGEYLDVYNVDTVADLGSDISGWIKDPTKKGRISADEYKYVFSLLEKLSPELYEEMLPKIKLHRELSALANLVQEDAVKGTGLVTAIGTLPKLAGYAGYFTGKATTGVKKVTGRIMEATPEFVKKLIDRANFDEKIKFVPLLKEVRKIANSGQRSRQAIMYSMYSNPIFPEFAKWMGSLGDFEYKYKDEK